MKLLLNCCAGEQEAREPVAVL